MIKIGVIGHTNKTKTINILSQILRLKNLNFKTIYFPEQNFNWDIDYWEQIDDNMDILIFRITKKSILNNIFNNIKFNIIIYTNSREEKEYKMLYENEHLLFEKLDYSDFIILNSDDSPTLSLFNKNKACVITYGLNSKSTITPSSIQEEAEEKIIQCCIQRNLTTLNKRIIEPQEFSIKTNILKPEEIYNILAAIITALISDIEIKNLNQLNANTRGEI